MVAGAGGEKCIERINSLFGKTPLMGGLLSGKKQFSHFGFEGFLIGSQEAVWGWLTFSSTPIITGKPLEGKNKKNIAKHEENVKLSEKITLKNAVISSFKDWKIKFRQAFGLISTYMLGYVTRI